VLAIQNAGDAGEDTGEETELPAMLATLGAWEDFFGPFHPQTLRLMTLVASTYRHRGDGDEARRLLEIVVTDAARHLGPEHEIRLAALGALSELFVAQRNYEKAGVLQRELLECRVRRLGHDHAETLAARAGLCETLLRAETHPRDLIA
jgi:hypothetical protein